MEVFPGVSMDPAVRFGKPCIAGTRIEIATVINDMGAGETSESVQASYDLTREQVLTCLRFAATLRRIFPRRSAPLREARRTQGTSAQIDECASAQQLSFLSFKW